MKAALRYNLEISSEPGIICGTIISLGSLAVRESFVDRYH